MFADSQIYATPKPILQLTCIRLSPQLNKYFYIDRQLNLLLLNTTILYGSKSFGVTPKASTAQNKYEIENLTTAIHRHRVFSIVTGTVYSSLCTKYSQPVSMSIQTNKDLIISLIKDDLINTKLVTGLSAIGLNASDYHLHLSTTIFQLMGFKDDDFRDEVFQQYLQLTKKTEHLNISESHNVLNDLALEIYNLLLQRSGYTPNRNFIFKNKE
jgi:hypothetical protein